MMLRKVFLLLLLIPLTHGLHAQSYKMIHDKAIVVDTHNDVLMRAADIGTVIDEDNAGKDHIDLNRFKKGGLDVQLFSVYSDGDTKEAYAYANRQMQRLGSCPHEPKDNNILFRATSLNEP